MKFTTSNPYRILKCILDYNTIGKLPQLSDIVAKLGYTSKGTIKFTLSKLKSSGLIKVNGPRRLYTYSITEVGIEKVKATEDIEDRLMLKTLLQCYGD